MNRDGHLEEVARDALANGAEREALKLVEPAAAKSGDARLWQWAGLLHRSLEQHDEALRCFELAAALAPDDAGVAHGHARVALEGGLPAVALFEHALRLAPGSGDVLLGLAAAKLASGEGEDAERDLDSALAAQPFWLEGHVQLAQLRAMLGRKAESAQSLDRAIAANPAATQLWIARFNLAINASDFEGLDATVARARGAGLGDPLAASFEAIAAAEAGDTVRADRLFAAMPEAALAAVSLWRVRHLLRSGRVGEALPIIDSGLASPGAANFWPYASIAWRLAGDPRSDWLEGDSRLVSTTDLPFDDGELEQLARHLRSLHVAKGEFLDQSVRGGTQTDGPLLSRIEPEIRKLRSKIVNAVEAYVARLPQPDPDHPLLGRRRDAPVRFAGSWSVRLHGAGSHANHVHPQGWISSALYVALPPGVSEDGHKGWLKLGSPPEELGLEMQPTAEVRPVVARLALFPSWMWHGTIPFDAGERLTVAFDVRPPN